jgi:Flp pilus assembly protein TadD
MIRGPTTLGTLRLRNKEPATAVALLRRALDLNPDDVTSLSNLGIAYTALGLAEDARATFEMVLRRDPDRVPALEHLALLEVEQERWAEAIAMASRALTLAPTSIIARRTLGVAYAGAGDRLRAFEQYRALAEVDLEAAARLFKVLMS